MIFISDKSFASFTTTSSDILGMIRPPLEPGITFIFVGVVVFAVDLLKYKRTFKIKFDLLFNNQAKFIMPPHR